MEVGVVGDYAAEGGRDAPPLGFADGAGAFCEATPEPKSPCARPDQREFAHALPGDLSYGQCRLGY